MSTSTGPKRRQRVLTQKEQRIRNWIAKNKGILTRLAKEFGLSVAFVQRIAYNHEAQSQGLRVERKLLALGCPLQQKIS